MGLSPISHPPGYVKTARPNRASTGPSMKMDERICLESASGMTCSLAPSVSTIRSIPSRAVRQPRLSSSRSMLAMSARCGQPLSRTGPFTSMHAASSGSTAFLAP